jgi:hypothetical protein
MSSSATSEVRKLIEKIDLTGYWRVVIRPTTFEETRIPLPKCKDYLAECAVLLRGWDYPHVAEAEIHAGQDFIECLTDWKIHIEFCRLYQSGQFYHRFAMREDYKWDGFESEAKRKPRSEPRFLSVLSTLYSFTEIFEFATRLASKGALGSNAAIDVGLYGLAGRTLDNRKTHLSGDYTCSAPELHFKKTCAAEDLIENSAALARQGCVDLFHRFGWLKLGVDAFIEEQKKLLEKRYVG